MSWVLISGFPSPGWPQAFSLRAESIGGGAGCGPRGAAVPMEAGRWVWEAGPREPSSLGNHFSFPASLVPVGSPPLFSVLEDLGLSFKITFTLKKNSITVKSTSLFVQSYELGQGHGVLCRPSEGQNNAVAPQILPRCPSLARPSSTHTHSAVLRAWFRL